MSFYRLSPEVPGGLGDNAVLAQRQGTYPLVTRLHFEFGPGTLGDDLMTCHPVYMVTSALADGLRQSALTGYALSTEVEVSVDENVSELEPDWPVPVIEWLQVSGVAGLDDFGLDSHASLVVSDAALSELRRYQISDCEIIPFAGEAMTPPGSAPPSTS